ncbi:MAG: polyketide synthase, partial [Proteobacteria bacterium]|nr:polyketide synthase [Pseudomonadota bacterium]
MPDHSDSDDNQNAIAIIGMSVRLPGASNLADYWDMLLNGKDAIHFFTENELKAAGVPPGQINDPNFIASRGYLAGVDEFDASFFGISPREAALMDPQHRVLMEVAWHAFEHSGYDPDQWDGDCSIFTSAGMNTYLPFNIFTNPGLVNEVGGFQLSIYNDKDFVPTRIAYALNTKGPAIDIGTACSSSLVGTHLACQHLLSYQSDLALVGGVTVHLPQETGDLVEAGSAYSPDGHCRPFDASPSGLVDGNGAVAIILKRLDDAVQDRDTIHAVIKGSAINNDGSEKVGYSAPSIQGQTQVIFEAQALAQITADQISYVEAHGTATPLGDPIEVAGLTQAFRETTDDTQFCGLGSVKSNIGHVDKAAGLAGLVKTVLGLKHEVMPPTANFKSPNPRLKIEETPFFVVAQPQPWERSDNIPRIAAISSFGVGGTNAHAIISESPLSTKQPTSDRPELIVLSAKSEPAVERLIAELQQSVDQQTGN